MKAVEEAGEEVPPQVGEVGEVGVLWIGVFGGTGEEVFAGFIDDGDVYVTRVSGEILAGFCHEAGGDAVFGAEGFDDISRFFFLLVGLYPAGKRKKKTKKG